MFIGSIGYSYIVGWPVIWMLIGFVAGDFLVSMFVHKQIRIQAERSQSLSYAGVLAQWFGNRYSKVRFLGGLITILFLTVNAAGQFTAANKATSTIFEWQASTGSILIAAAVIIYCFVGGIRASIWTDIAQAAFMIMAMALIFFTSVAHVGGVQSFYTMLHQVSPTYTNWFPYDMASEGAIFPLLFVFGWFCGGLGLVGQPHIMTRFMTLNDPDQFKTVRIYYYIWYILFSLLTVGVGLSCRVILQDTTSFDPETALPILSLQLFTPILLAFVLAGLFSAIISTADSQILSCTAAITSDFKQSSPPSIFATRCITVCVTLLALGIALTSNQSVFSLLMIAWSALGSTFAPLVITFALGGKPSERVALAMMLTGLSTVILWRYLGLSTHVYEIAPGIIAGLSVYLLSKLFQLKSSGTYH